MKPTLQLPKALDHLELLPYQSAFAANNSRFKIGLWARQTGKDHTAVAEAVIDCLNNPGTTWIILAAGERQARESLAKAKDWADILKFRLHDYEESFGDHDLIRSPQSAIRNGSQARLSRAEITNGSRLFALPANPCKVGFCWLFSEHLSPSGYCSRRTFFEGSSLAMNWSEARGGESESSSKNGIMRTLEELAGYNPHTAADRADMLKSMGLASIEDLFSQVPAAIRLPRSLNLPEALNEWELQKRLRRLADENLTVRTHLSFLGGGAYEHYIPAVVPAIASRGEYLTAYTPYQPEMSQGLLRMLHDFQRVMGHLLGLPKVNCSVYDGATALAEAAWMCCSIRGGRRLAVSEAIWPQWRSVLETYMAGRSVELRWIPTDPASGETSGDALAKELKKEKFAGFLFQSPNYFGVIEPAQRLIEISHRAETLAHASCNPMMLGCLKSPGEQGADIVSCEAQPLGLALNAGGPYLGVMATRDEFQKFLPGRIVGECSDLKGEPALALVMEEREQHVSRDKATSHICSNQALMALRALVYLSVLGEHGFRRVAELNAEKAHYLCDRLRAISGVRLAKSGRFFNEFLLELPVDVNKFLPLLQKKQIFAGLDFGSMDPACKNHLLIAVTEIKSKSELDRMAETFAETIAQLRA